MDGAGVHGTEDQVIILRTGEDASSPLRPSPLLGPEAPHLSPGLFLRVCERFPGDSGLEETLN